MTQLSRRQAQLVHLLVAGKTDREIAGKLHIQIGTVKMHLHNLRHKLGAHNRTAVAVWALEGFRVRSTSTHVDVR